MKDKEMNEEMEKDIVRMAGLDVYDKAKYFYEQGYRKLPKDSVVLSKEEYDELTLTKQSIFDMLEERDDKVRKETAKEFAERLKKKFKGHGILFYDKEKDCHYYRSIGKEIDELLKE